MKRLNVRAGTIALVFKNGNLKRLLAEGNHWLFWGEEADTHNLTFPFASPYPLNLLLRNTELAEKLQVVEVSDTQLALRFENGLLKGVLTAGRYAFWKELIDYRFVTVNLAEPEIDTAIEPALLQHTLLQPYVRTFTVETHEKALLFINGKFARTLEGGVYHWWKNAVPVMVARVDTRKQQLEINGQEMLTRDKAALRINAWAQYRVTDIKKAVLENREYDKQLYITFQLALREYVAGYNFDELLEKKETIAPFVLEAVMQKSEALGVQVEGFGIRDIVLPGDVKEIMNQVLVAEKKAQANTIMRREETASTRSLLNTAKLMEDNPLLWKLKEMEYMEKVAEKIQQLNLNGNGQFLEQLKQLFVPQQ